MNISICFITNIPAPYREKIHATVSHEKSFSYYVIFCQKKEPNRKWSFILGDYKKVFLNERVFKYKGRFIHFNPDVLTIIKKLNPSIVITTGYTPTFLLAYIWSKFKKKKHIVMTDGWLGSEEKLSFIHKILRKIIIKKSNAWIGASSKSIKSLEYYGAKPSAIFRSHLCVDNDKFYSSPFEKRSYDILFSGQFIERKLPGFFVDVANIIKKKRGFCSALLLGDGPLKSDVQKKMHDTTDNYCFAGFLEQDKLPQMYSNAKVLLFPTAQDPWGIVANEACAAGTPVITCNNAGAANDLIIHNYNGFILPLDAEKWADHAIQLLEKKELWNTFSENAQRKVREFNFQVAAEGIVKAIEYVL